jgi:hypothetical protein
MSAAGRALSKALDNPADWIQPDEYRIVHRPSNQAYWIANGGFFFNGDVLHGTRRCLGLIERHWLYAKAMRTINRPVANRFEDALRKREQK